VPTQIGLQSQVIQFCLQPCAGSGFSVLGRLILVSNLIFLGLKVCYNIYQVFLLRMGAFTQKGFFYPRERTSKIPFYPGNDNVSLADWASCFELFWGYGRYKQVAKTPKSSIRGYNIG